MDLSTWCRRHRLASVLFCASLFPFPTIASDWFNTLGCRPKKDDYYHPKAVRLHESGVVLVEFSVSTKGLIERIEILQSNASDSLKESAILFVSDMRCKPGKDWIESGGPQERHRVNVVFHFFGEEPPKPIDAEADELTISTNALPTSRKWQ